ncbi:MAG: hypothetical protein WBX02_22240, partial [Terriglobales bacterium]
VRAWKRSTTYSSIRRRHGGPKSKMFGDSMTVLSCEVMALRKSDSNVGIEGVSPATVGPERGISPYGFVRT